MEVLDLSRNSIKNINSYTFLKTNKLKTINLSNNKIKDLQVNYPGLDPPQSILKDCSENLEALYLSHNNISQIYQDWIILMSRLQILDLSYNNLPNLSVSMIDLYQKNVCFSKFRYSLLFFFLFFFQYASLASVTARKLTMDLSYNKIDRIDFDIAEDLARYKFGVNDTINEFDIGVRVVLKGNPLVCDCRSYDLVNYFRDQFAPQVL